MNERLEQAIEYAARTVTEAARAVGDSQVGFREQTAARVLAAMVACSGMSYENICGGTEFYDAKARANTAVAYADALIAELSKKKED